MMSRLVGIPKSSSCSCLLIMPPWMFRGGHNFQAVHADSSHHKRTCDHEHQPQLLLQQHHHHHESLQQQQQQQHELQHWRSEVPQAPGALPAYQLLPRLHCQQQQHLRFKQPAAWDALQQLPKPPPSLASRSYYQQACIPLQGSSSSSRSIFCQQQRPAAVHWLVNTLQQLHLQQDQQQVCHYHPPHQSARPFAIKLPTQHFWRQQQQWQQQQQVRHYHPSQHRARALTSKLLSQQRWQDLQLLYDAAGGGDRLNPIQLSALLQQLSRLAPPPELMAAAERRQLRGYVNEVAAACVAKLHRFDAVGLSNIIHSLHKLGCILPLREQPGGAAEEISAEDNSSSSSSSGNSSSSSSARGGGAPESSVLFAELMDAAARSVASANSHSCGMLLSALTMLQQQQQQQQQGLASSPQQQQQQLLLLWQRFIAALIGRLEQLSAAGQLSCSDASKLCLTVSRLMGALAAQRAAAAAAATAAAAVGTQQQQQQQQPGGDMPPDMAVTSVGVGVNKQLRSLLSFVVQQATQAAQPPAAAAVAQQQQQLLMLADDVSQQQQQHLVAALSESSRVLYAVAKAWVWPGWQPLLSLLQQYSTALDTILELSTFMPGMSSVGSSSSRGRRSPWQQQQQQQGLGGKKGKKHQSPFGLQESRVSSSGSSGVSEEVSNAQRDSLAPLVWAAGKLLEQRQQQQWQQQQQQPGGNELLQQELQHIEQLWQALGPVLQACCDQLLWLGPLQLAQLATGLSKLITSSSKTAASAAAAAPATATAGGGGGGGDQAAAAVVSAIEREVGSPLVQKLLKQHMSRVEALLPLLAQPHRLQLAAAYNQLGVKVPRTVVLVFERDAQQQWLQQQQLLQHSTAV